MATPWTVHGILQARILESFLSPQYLPDPEIDLESPTRICLQSRRPQFDSWFRKISWRRDRLPTPVFLGFPCGSASEESACNVGDLGSSPGLGRSPGEGKGYPLQYSGLENSMDCTVPGVTKSRTRLSDFHFHLSRKGLTCSEGTRHLSLEMNSVRSWSFPVCLKAEEEQVRDQGQWGWSEWWQRETQ